MTGCSDDVKFFVNQYQIITCIDENGGYFDGVFSSRKMTSNAKNRLTVAKKHFTFAKIYPIFRAHFNKQVQFLMTSRLQKHKQIVSMLNSRHDAPFPESEQPPANVAENPANSSLLRQVFEFHRSMVQNLNSGLLTIDLAGEIIFANKVAARLLGLEVSDLLGKKVVDLFNKSEDGEAFLRECTRRGQRIDEWEAQLFHPQYRQITVGIDAAYMEDTRNSFQGIVLLLRNLTEVMEMRNQVKRMEQLALLGEMAAGLAHEVRNPLAGIKATAQLLEEDDELDAMKRETLKRLIREVDKANHRVSEFLKFARPNRAKADFHQVREIVENTLHFLDAKMQWQKITATTAVPETLAPVFVDKTQIEQVLLNLFINAMDAMPNGGQLHISAKPRAIRAGKRANRHGVVAQQQQSFIEISVRDSGEGIAKENLGQIFRPFFTTKITGVGLGLAICSRLVEENRGKIDVLSHIGKGTTIILALPAFAAG